MVLVSLVSALPVLANPGIDAKQAEARQVLGELQQLSARLGRAVEAYDGASYRLGQIRGQLGVNRVEMRVARNNLRVADHRLARLLRDLYVSGGGDSTLAVILGAKSLDDVITRLDTASRLSSQAEQIVQAVRTFRNDVARRGAALRRARAVQSRLVAERAAAKQQIETGIAQRQQLLSSIKSEIITLKRNEAARQAALAAQARARLIAERIAQRRALNAVTVGATAQSPGAFGATVVPPSRSEAEVVSIAMRYLGDPYVWGTAGPNTLRLLRPGHVRVRPGRHLTTALRGRPVELRRRTCRRINSSLATSSSSPTSTTSGSTSGTTTTSKPHRPATS